jgi:hypothetical protein
MLISNTNKRKAYITEASEHDRPFTMLVRHHTKSRPTAKVVTLKEEEQPEGEDGDRADEGQVEESEGEAEGMIDEEEELEGVSEGRADERENSSAH